MKAALAFALVLALAGCASPPAPAPAPWSLPIMPTRDATGTGIAALPEAVGKPPGPPQTNTVTLRLWTWPPSTNVWQLQSSHDLRTWTALTNFPGYPGNPVTNNYQFTNPATFFRLILLP